MTFVLCMIFGALFSIAVSLGHIAGGTDPSRDWEDWDDSHQRWKADE